MSDKYRIPGFAPEFGNDIKEARKDLFPPDFLFDPVPEWMLKESEAQQKKIYQETLDTIELVAEVNGLIIARECLLPTEFVETIIGNSDFSKLSRDPKKFPETLFAACLKRTLTLAQFAALFQQRGEWMRERLNSRHAELQASFNDHAPRLVAFVTEWLWCTPEEQALLKKRLANVRGIYAMDPFMAMRGHMDGDWDGIDRTMRVIDGKPYHGTIVHEAFHAMSTSLLELRDLNDEDDVDENGTLLPPTFMPDEARAGIAVSRVSDDEKERLSFLNEAVTETLTMLYFQHHRSLPPLTDVERILQEEGGVYETERHLLDYIHAPQHLLPNEAQRTAFAAAIKNMERVSGVLMDEMALDNKLYRAYLFDNVNEGGEGRAKHFRAWSAKMREYYGNGILVALDDEWESAKARRKDPSKACTDLLVSRVIATWAHR